MFEVATLAFLSGLCQAGGLRCQLCLFDAKHCSRLDASLLSTVADVGRQATTRENEQTYGSYMVHIWFIYGSYMVNIW